MTGKSQELLDYLSSYVACLEAKRDRRLGQKLSVFVDLAISLASLSTCSRRAVGCVVVPLDLSSVLAIGYNGPPAGEDNDSCDGGIGTCQCIHAEANALVKLRDARNSLLITTVSPCLHCAGLIVNSGVIQAVAYVDEYRDLSGLARLQVAGIVTVRVQS
jgi:dCMP deaminase